MSFAKIFESPKYGQICVIADTDDEGKPCMRAMCKPEGFGICELKPAWKDDDEGWEARDGAFEKLDLRVAEMLVEEVFNMIDVK